MHEYTSDMTKRLIDIDDDLLERARLALGAPTMVATVREALHRVTDVDAGNSYVELLRSLTDLDPDPDPDPAAGSAAWRVGGR